jgi:putative aldouronate transport system substrate-binding protein
MKMSKRFVAILLTLALVIATFAACSSGSSATSTATSSASSKAEESKSTTSTESSKAESSTASTSGTVHPCRIVEPGTLPSDYETGIAAVNKKLAEDGVDIEVSITRIPWDAYSEKLNLMLTSGEQFEVLNVMQDVKNLSTIAGMGAIISVTDLIKKYPDLESKFTDLEWQGTLYKGERYAIPCSWRSFDNVMGYMNYRADVAKKVGYDSFPTTLDGIEDLMKKSQDYILTETSQKAYTWFHQNQDTAHWLHRSYSTYPFYVENSLGIVLARQDGTIDSFYESDEFKQDANTYYKLYQDGLVNPDILNLDSQKKYDDAKYGAFLPSQTFDPATGVTIKTNTGIDADVEWVNSFGDDKVDMVYTYCQNLNAISSTAEDPESGLKFFNWLYASKANHDLFHYGIEGTHYKQIGDNRMEQVKGDDGNPIYYIDTWMTGYMPYMNYASDAPDSQIDYMTYKSKDYVVSPIAGFNFNATNVQSELTNLQTEIIASIYPIKVGMVSYDDNITDAISKLKAAGLDTYLTEYRTQFAQYLKDNPQVLELAKEQKG